MARLREAGLVRASRHGAAAGWSHGSLRLEHGSPNGEAVAFFLFDPPKVLLLLTGVVTLVSALRSFVSPDRVRRALAAAT